MTMPREQNMREKEMLRVDCELRKAIDGVFAKALLRNAVIMGKQDEEILLGIAGAYTKIVHTIKVEL